MLPFSPLVPVPVYGVLNRHNPYVGYFHYSPSLSLSLCKSSHSFFQDDLLSIDELERRKRVKLHPFTGCFHYAPGQYSDLHGLERYRRNHMNDTAKINGTIKHSNETKKSHKSFDHSKDQLVSQKKPNPSISSRSFDDLVLNEKLLSHLYRQPKDLVETCDVIKRWKLKRFGSLDEKYVDSRISVPLSGHKNNLDLKEWISSPMLTSIPETHSSHSHHPHPGQPNLSSPTLSSWQVHHGDGLNSLHLNQDDLHHSHQYMSEKYHLYPNHLLGEGSYARIYLGKQRDTHHYVAIKVIKQTLKALDILEDESNHLKREIENQSKLWSPHIVSIFGVYKSVNHLYLVLDYCSGGTLEQMLQLRNRLDEDETRIIAYQLFCAIVFTHQNGILHGDIKPANIMFQPQSNSLQKHSSHSISSPSLSPSHSPVHTMNPIDLLYEKRRQEGKLTITLNQLPVIDLHSDDTHAHSLSLSPTDFITIQEDYQTALLCERCIHSHDIHSIPNENHSLPSVKLRRDVSLGSTSHHHGVTDFLLAAKKNKMNEIKTRKRSETVSDVPVPHEDMKRVDSQKYSHDDNDLTNFSIPSHSLSLDSKDIESNIFSHKHTTIRYKSPYGLLLKLCDFGQSQQIPNIHFYPLTGDVYRVPYTKETKNIGTEGYLSPELMEQKSYGIATDLWAIGILLYKTISGNYPFIPFDSYRTKELKFNGVVWKKVSLNCKNLIRSLLVVDERERITAQQALNHEWFQEILLISNILIPSDDIIHSLLETKEYDRTHTSHTTHAADTSS